MINVSRFDFDTGGLIYFKIINQLFVRLYAMELYITVLFFLVRDFSNQFVYVEQAVTIILTTAFIVAYQILLNWAYKSLFNNLLIMLDKITTSTHIRSSRQWASKPFWLRLLHSHFAKFLNVTGRFIEEKMSESEDFHSTDVMDEIQNEILTVNQSVIWILRDKFGVNNDEVRQIQNNYNSILINDKNAQLNEKGIIVWSEDSPKSSNKWRRLKKLNLYFKKSCP